MSPETDPVKTLASLAPGTRAKVMAILGGRGFNRRLASMGIFPGTQLSLVKGGARGPVIVDVLGSRFLLGHGMAQKVVVVPLSQAG